MVQELGFFKLGSSSRLDVKHLWERLDWDWGVLSLYFRRKSTDHTSSSNILAFRSQPSEACGLGLDQLPGAPSSPPCSSDSWSERRLAGGWPCRSVDLGHPSMPLQTSQWKSTWSSSFWDLPAPAGLFDTFLSPEGITGWHQNWKYGVFLGFYRKNKLAWRLHQTSWSCLGRCFSLLFFVYFPTNQCLTALLSE